MSPASAARSTCHFAIWALVGAGLVVFFGANAHLVYVALRSQPECVEHAKPGLTGGETGRYSAAKSACASR